ncbi:hypothetical protein K435DRAFT_714928 [Dendrothele bispora CBS 962.96]|uniref:P-loop containing nucleoside triphosphate hydrolase protein n=1 Tax=Dendrothele bispora (strain CBS 962.96) TaxID=1314807 RepID=A0A4S8MM56_DENBC|nr:hypothetical protein K435DRAFT_714928 [Dendrothele bispora CBS 962.96]
MSLPPTTSTQRLPSCSVCGAGCFFSSNNSDVFSLSKLIPAGTVEIHLHPDSLQPYFASVAEDGWHHIDVPVFENFRFVDEVFLQTIPFLLRNHFISTTFFSYTPTILITRIYIIPYDLPNCQGRLSYRARSREVLLASQTYMLQLLPLISQVLGNWHGSGLIQDTISFLDSSADRRTLPEIYGDLVSPQPLAPEFGSQSNSQVIRRLLDFTDDLGGFGLRSTLLMYQRRSVAQMLQKECCQSPDVCNPLYIQLLDMNQKPCYYQPGSTEILKEPYMVTPSQGGVLCEELGTGKTVMVLALVLSTIKQLSVPEHSFIDQRPVLTPLSLRHFPSGEFAATRNRYQVKKEDISSSRVPSFREILLHLLCSKPDASIPNTNDDQGLQKYENQERLSELYSNLPSYELWRRYNPPFYLHHDDDPTGQRMSSRGQGVSAPRLMYITSATLIVVPANLISQWDREILKHCEVLPRVLIIRSGTLLPNARELANEYDIILMPYNRFTDEDKRKNIKKLHSWRLCTCPEIPHSRIPQCKCRPPDVSPLLQVRWRRLVIDEGHVSASLSTRLTPFCKLLSVQSRWIVTGTPTTNLLGLSFGNKSNEEFVLDNNVNEGLLLDDSVKMDVDSEDDIRRPLETPTHEDVTESGTNTDTPLSIDSGVPRIWNHLDHLDMVKLINMIAHFVGMRFLTDSQLVKSHLMDALFDGKGPRPGAIRMLVQLMQAVMIRHKINDVEKEIVLPRLEHERIYLDLSTFAAMSYNALQAAIAINAVDSERRDEDYMFHPNNTSSLQLTVKNMSQLMFWSVDDELYHVDELRERTLELLQEAQDRCLPTEDIALVREAYVHVCVAAENKLWRKIQTFEDVPYYVHNVKPSVFQTWSRLPDDTWTLSNATNSISGLMHPDRLTRLRRLVVRNPLFTETKICAVGREVSENDQKLREQYMEMVRKKERKEKRERRDVSKTPKHIPVKPQHDAQAPTQKVLIANKTASSSETVADMQKELARLKMLEDGEMDPSAVSDLNARQAEQPSMLLHSSVIADIRVGSSASTKLNYIVNEVLKYSKTEKFLIFSDSELTLAHVAEALQLVDVKFLRFSTQVPSRIREQTVQTFETSDMYRVFLMELKHGARGLNLVSASRVIFCEPVWQADVESQAIKRAHRIGQTKPVKVKTLAIRNTAEEKMLERRQIIKQAVDGKVPKLLEETGIRHFIADPKFINVTPETKEPGLDVPLIRLPPLKNSEVTQSAASDGPSPRKRVKIIVQDPQGSQKNESSPPKNRSIRFA